MAYAADLPYIPTPAAGTNPAVTVPGLIEATAARLPHAIAVTAGPISCSYSELTARFSNAAQGLLARGVAAGDVVVVRGGRSLDMVIAMLGVLRAGAVVTMIDITQPDGRTRDVLDQADPRLVIDTSGDDQSWDAGVAPVVTLAEVAGAADQNTDLPPVDAESAAYLCFTSGTTGQPRGVLGWNGALAHFCMWEQRVLRITKGDRVAQMAALTFDAVFKDLFPALIGGATVCLPPTDRPFTDIAQVLAWLRDDAVTVVQTVPSVLSALLSGLLPGSAFPSLRLVCLSGEPLTGSLVNRWRAATSKPVVSSRVTT